LIFSGAHAGTDPSLNLAITKIGQNIVLNWFAVNAVPYQLESSANLVTWSNVGPAITGSNTPQFVTNSIVGQSGQFYRVTRLFPAANGTAAFNPSTGLLTIVGDDADNIITVSRSGDLIVVNGGAMPITGGVPAVTNTVLIQVLGCGGNDQITMGSSLPTAHLFGDTGNDTLIGGSAAEMLVGGPGNDFVDGNQGNDIAYLGEGDDTFQWDPGDGSDVVEGQSGNDTLLFNASNVSEIIDASAIGSRCRISRNVASVIMDLDGIERVDFRVLGGADNVVVNSLAGTSVAQVNIDLAAAAGTGDAQVDVVTINGTAASDTINVATNAGALEISGLSAKVRVLNAEATNDVVVINGLGGDLINVNGSAEADLMTVLPSPTVGYARVVVEGFSASVDVSTNVSKLSINGLGGPDTISGSGNLAGLGIPIKMDGGDGNDIILGSNAAEVLVGGPGDDFIDGNQGNDLVFLGEDNDTFRWDPGDGSDTVEGEGGADILIFNGANVNENLSLSANGMRLRLFRDIASITLDVDGVERVDLQALGGADNIVVNSLAGTAVTQVNIDLAAAGGAGDAQADAVIVNGTAGSDTFNVTNNASVLEVSGLAAQVRILHGEIANDRLVINGVGGDLVNVNGSAAADTMTFLPSPVAGYLRASSTGYTASVDVTGALTLSINGLGGADTINSSGDVAALAIPIRLDGGDDGDYINGSNASELILGGPGNDIIDGNQGNDTVLMGDGDDIFVWDAGDGSDTVEGQGGTDALVFYGSNVNEIVDFSAVGTRFQLSRNVENVVLDVDGVERIGLQTLAGADILTVNSLAGTAVESVIIELAATRGGTSGDAQADLITLNGTASPDTINITANAGEVDVSGLVPSLQIAHADAANDSLIVNGLGGVDIFYVEPGVNTLMTVVTNQN
jgi:Ca2+-binding RTX toxin-like protein